MKSRADIKGFYSILGVQKNSSTTEIRAAYRKLAMKWHPDKCSDAREQAKLKFQAIQEAYSVLSDDNQRLLYDAGQHQEAPMEYGMADFLGELASMMNSRDSKRDTAAEFDDFKNIFMNITGNSNFATTSHQETVFPGVFQEEIRMATASDSSSNLRDCQSQNFQGGGFETEGFCMGSGGPEAGTDGRGTARKSARTRKKRCTGNAGDSSSHTVAWCDTGLDFLTAYMAMEAREWPEGVQQGKRGRSGKEHRSQFTMW